MTIEHSTSTVRPHAERARLYVERCGQPDARLRALTGDASDRRYVRVIRAGAPSFVLAVHAGSIDPATLPFINVARLFEALGVPTPAVLGHAADLGVLALEDLGDTTLQAYLRAKPHADRRALYEEAIDLILLLQRGAPAFASQAFVPFGVAFDVEKLTWELEYFVRYFLVAYRGVALSDAARQALAGEFASVAAELAAEPRVLCHRDFHSRNLMLHHGRLVAIDFQDARMGPDTYDLVSLLRDSYVELDGRLVDALIDDYLKASGARPGDFRARFDLTAVQRNLKALGTFGYQIAVAGNDVYAEYIPRTLAYVRETTGRHRRFDRLRDLLAVHIAELG